MKLKLIYFLFGITFLFMSCGHKVELGDARHIEHVPAIYPDYDQITIPPNIAPLNFNIEEKGIQYYVSIKGVNGKAIVMLSGKSIVDISINKWHKLLANNVGKRIEIEVSVQDSLKKWNSYKPLEIEVAKEEIDSHLAYRLINVAYVLWKKMGLYQRDLTSFEEKPIMVNRNSEGNCMNCHSFSHNNPDYMMFHMRSTFGGTVVATPDSVFKLNTKTDNTIGAGGYPAWNPDGKHLAFSVNMVRQFFHAVDIKNEIYDKASDLVVYNIVTNTITTDPSISTVLRESMPYWSPDGNYLYFCRAPQFADTLMYNETYYDLMRIAFDPNTDTFGKIDTILLASDLNSTISFPRISPDGKYLLFTRASHGYFTIFNKTADLYFLSLESGEITEYPFNSNTVESYHTWSSNSRWMVFSSKRIDGTTTRPFISYIDEYGKARKPFVLPQKDPLFYQSFKTNYNVPELITGEVKVDRLKLLDAVLGEPDQVLFDSRINGADLEGVVSIQGDKSLH
ncbi:MAG: hypothetical protein ACERKD_08425 [Prolixibacteraceae bacterium]